MKVRIEQDWLTQNVKVWIYEPSESGPHRLTRMIGRDTWETVEVDPGAIVEPSFSIPEELFRQIVAEGAGLLPIDRAGERHLEDAIKVRDRLMDAFLPGGGA